MSTAPAPPNAASVAETVRTRLPFSAELARLIPLPGDASNRRYFRLELTGGAPSVILMQLASPEAFKQSEEAASGTESVSELPFVNVLTHLTMADLPVPVLYCYDEPAGLLYLEDFGDVTLAQAYREASAERHRLLYESAIDLLLTMQARASRPAPGCVAFSRTFTIPLLMWEFDHFLEYGVEVRHGRTIEESDKRLIRSEFHKIAECLVSQPAVFVHRDYHSRNLMVQADGSLGMIDFQDALLGPVTYDLASLLRDAYIELDDALIDHLLARYQEQGRDEGQRLGYSGEFRQVFDLTCLQRNLKAAGRFIYIDRVKGNPSFLAHIPRTLGYVRRNLLKYAELQQLHERLMRYVPELA